MERQGNIPITIALCMSLVSVLMIVLFIVETGPISGLFFALACITIGLSVSMAYFGFEQKKIQPTDGKSLRQKTVCLGWVAFALAVGFLTVVNAVISWNFSLIELFSLLLSISLGGLSTYTFCRIK